MPIGSATAPFVLPTGVTTISTTPFITASDPAGYQGAYNFAASLVFRPGSSVVLQGPTGTGTYTYTTGIQVTTRFPITFAGTAATASTLDANPITAMTNNGDGSWDVTMLYTIAGSGQAVGYPLTFRALDASYTGAARGRDLAGSHLVVAMDTGAKTVTIRVWDRGGRGLDTGLIGAAVHYTDVRGSRTLLNFQMTRAAADQGAFTVAAGCYLNRSSIAVMGNRTASGVPSTGAPTTAGTQDTAGILLNPGAYATGTSSPILGWGGNGVQQLAGSTLDNLDLSVANCYQNGVYPQQNATTNVARGIISGCHIGVAGTLNSQVEIPDGVVAFCDYGSQCTGGSMTYFGGTAHISSNVVALYNDDSFTDAEGSDLNGLNNGTNVVIPQTGHVRYTVSAVDYNQQNYLGTVAGLPAATKTGLRATVTNANLGLTLGIGTVVAGGGANVVPVVADGVDWRIG